MTQALGYAVCEEMTYDENGVPRERSFVVNAIHDAVGVWLNEIPATPERVLAALKAQR